MRVKVINHNYDINSKLSLKMGKTLSKVTITRKNLLRYTESQLRYTNNATYIKDIKM